MNWFSVKEKIPEETVEVLVVTRSKNGVRNVDKGYMFLGRWVHRGKAEVTHWMPIPSLPGDSDGR